MTQGDIICTRCGRSGHVAASCTQPIIPLQLRRSEARTLEIMRKAGGALKMLEFKRLSGLGTQNVALEALGAIVRLGLAERSAFNRATPATWTLTEAGRTAEYQTVARREPPDKQVNRDAAAAAKRERDALNARIRRAAAAAAKRGETPERELIKRDIIEIPQSKRGWRKQQVWRRPGEPVAPVRTHGVPSVFALPAALGLVSEDR